MLTMGFNLFFQGSEYYCTDILGVRYKCTMKEACKQNNYDIDKMIVEGTNNLVSDFQLYCGNEKYNEWAGTFYFISLMLGAICFPPIADGRGRKIALVLSCLITGVSLVMCGIVQRFDLWILMVCFAGLGLGG